MSDVRWQQVEDLRKGAKFILIDSYSLEAEDAERIGMMLAEMAGQFAAQAIEAQRAETTKIGSVADESAVPNGNAPKGAI